MTGSYQDTSMTTPSVGPRCIRWAAAGGTDDSAAGVTGIAGCCLCGRSVTLPPSPGDGECPWTAHPSTAGLHML